MKRTAPPAEHEVRPWPVPERAGDAETLLTRLRVVACRRRLDQSLAEGADPRASAALTLRARQLTGRRARNWIARSLDELMQDAAPRDRWSSRVRPACRSVDSARAHLHRICDLLRGPGPVHARGVALTIALLSDAASPLYSSSETASAWYWARLTVDALEGHA